MNDFVRKISRLRQQAPYIPKTLQLVWQASGMWMAVWLLFLLVQGVLPVAIVFMTRHVIDSLSGSARHGLTPSMNAAQEIALPIALLALMLLLERVLESTGQWVRTLQAEKVRDHMAGLIHDKVLAVDLSFYDSPAYYDRLHRARMDAMSRPLALLEGMGSLLQNTLTLGGMATLLLSYSIWIPLLLFAGTIPALWVTAGYADRLNEWRRNNTVAERRCEYFDWLLTMRDAAQEIRFFDLGGHYRAAYQQLRTRLRGEKLGLEKRKLLTEITAGLLAMLTTGMAMVWMISRTLAGKAGIGDIVLFYQAFGQGQRLMANLLRNTGEIYQNVLFLENLFELLNTVPKVRDPIDPLPAPQLSSGVKFEDIEFRYPESERCILKKFNLELKAGQIAAIVGENGEGKTTLLKLLCRFYDPDKGRISADGIDIRLLRQTDWRRKITVLFQEPVRYHVSAADNIAHGNITGNISCEEIEKAAKISGAYEVIERLPEGFETVLGKWFGGAELSAGEWQRVGLARAFLRDAKLIILDEPTSMLDIWSEAQWFERFRSVAEGCTVLIISHRLTTTMQADVIHVMQNGKIVESGTHAELLDRQGRYSEAWIGSKLADAPVRP
jgi:ATP-binding cassette subfamily B protein